MQVYRIASPKFIADLSGNGAKLYGGRWNDVGQALVYFASSRAMAVMEVLVHLRPEELAKNFALAVFEIDSEKILELKISDLPTDWKAETKSGHIKRIGAKFITDNEFLILKVPSFLIEEEFNLILNPNHVDAHKVKLIHQRPFNFDLRFKV